MKNSGITPENCPARVLPMYSILCKFDLDNYPVWGLKTPYGIIEFDTKREAALFQRAFKGDGK